MVHRPRVRDVPPTRWARTRNGTLQPRCGRPRLYDCICLRWCELNVFLLKARSGSGPGLGTNCMCGLAKSCAASASAVQAQVAPILLMAARLPTTTFWCLALQLRWRCVSQVARRGQPNRLICHRCRHRCRVLVRQWQDRRPLPQAPAWMCAVRSFDVLQEEEPEERHRVGGSAHQLCQGVPSEAGCKSWPAQGSKDRNSEEACDRCCR